MVRLPYTSKMNFLLFLEKMKSSLNLKYSTRYIDLISEAGDSTGSPFNHWRWKKRLLPDIVIWPQSIDQIKPMMDLAIEYKIPIVPRGGGTCYYGSSVPGIGGIILDMKCCNKFQINLKKRIVSCQGGTTFYPLINELKKLGFELAGYPSSARSATIAGWISTGAKAGFGTVHPPDFYQSIKQIKLIDGKAEEQILDFPEIIDHFLGSHGILGVITEITLKIYPKTQKFPFLHFVSNESQLINAVEKVIENPDIFFLRFGNMPSTNIPLNFHVFTVYSIHDSARMDYLEREPTLNAEKEWKNRFDYETKFKQNFPTLFIQQLWINFRSFPQILSYYKSLSAKYSHQTYWYAMLGKNSMLRLLLLIPTDPSDWLHFMVSKAIGHFTVLQAYKHFDNQVYIYGLQNTPYLHHFEIDSLHSWKNWKNKRDPFNLLNPLKITTTRVSVTRLSIMFRLNLLIIKIYNFLHRKTMKREKNEI